MKTRYKILTSIPEIDRLVECCKETGYCSFDFETNAEPMYKKSFYPTILSISFQPGSSCIIPLGHFDSPFKDNWKKVLRRFGESVIENPHIVKIAWNAKFDNQIMYKYGINIKGVILDGMLAKYLLNEERPNGLKEMVDVYLPDFGGYENYEGSKLPWDKKPLEPLSKYAGQDTDCTFRLTLFFEKRLMDTGLYPLYRHLIMPASFLLTQAERKGMLFDEELNKKLVVDYGARIEEFNNKMYELKPVIKYQRKLIELRKSEYIHNLQMELYKLKEEGKLTDKQRASREEKIARVTAGEFKTKAEEKIFEKLNFRSVTQLRSFLFSKEGLGLKPMVFAKDAKTNRVTENPATSEDALIAVKDQDKSGFVEYLLGLREIQTIYTTFMVSLGDLVQDDHRVHPSFFLHTTTSGRLSSRNPNGQNIPKTTVNPDVKKQFICPPGTLFLAYDYSQAELRIMAHLSGDETLLKAFSQGWDPHLAIACKKYSEDYENIKKIYEDDLHPEHKKWKIRRKEAKCLVFGAIYGIMAKKLSEQLSDPKSGLVVSKEEAQDFLDDFFKQFPKIKKFMDTQTKLMEEQGYVTSLFGRRRRCPEIWSSDNGKHLAASRQSFNAPCQSAASDMALFSSILIYHKMREGGLPYMPEIDTVHDSIYMYAKPQDINVYTIHQIWDICRNPDTKRYFGFYIDDVDMSMDFTIGRTMAEELPFIPGYNYNNMLDPSFDLEEYYKEYAKYKGYDIKDFPNLYSEEYNKIKSQYEG